MSQESFKNCTRCGEQETKFYGRSTICRACTKQTVKLWREKNKDKQRLISKRARVKHKYGLDLEDVVTEGECPICLKTDKRLVIDHCHTSGRVRGFICHNCNTLLGHVENTDKMKRVQEYLTFSNRS